MSLPALPSRADDTDKSRMGRLVVVAGAHGMAGAAVLCASAALRSGVGYVDVVCPAAITADLAAAVPSALTHPCGDASRHFIDHRDLDVIAAAVRNATAVVIGPGLGAGVEAWLDRALELAAHLPVLVDADGLNAMSRGRDGLRDRASLRQRTIPLVLTPHEGEAARLLNIDRAEIHADRRRRIVELVDVTGAVVVLKGARTLVAAPGAAVWEAPTGNAGLAKAGSGDVLSGLIGGLLARGMAPFDAAVAGVWIHGRAADVLAASRDIDTYIPSDLADVFATAFTDYRREVQSAAP
jgi:hydroxyethylthiazole kinase-like uncharacterized protein yjeF